MNQAAEAGIAPAPAGAAARELRASAQPAAQQAEVAGEQRFTFTGSGGEYFRIWVVNLLLTIATLGVYSAWAKVRRLQYFYRNTQVAGAVFDYHGNPQAILNGRLLALGLLLAYKFAAELSIAAAVLVGLVLMAVMPWLLSRAFRFKMANSSYRGLRFRFQGTVGDAYRMLILFPLILAFTGLFVWSLVVSYSQRAGIGLVLLVLGLSLLVIGGVVPYAHHLLKRYQHDNAYFGQAPFFYHARASGFFKIYAKALGMVLLGVLAVMLVGVVTGSAYAALLATPLGWLIEFLYGLFMLYVLYLFARPYLESRIQNLVWNKTELADHRFASSVSARKLLWIHATNLLLIVLTAGLYKPFGAIRLLRYRVACMSLVVAGTLEDFLADSEADRAGALGQEAGDFFDVDIAL